MTTRVNTYKIPGLQTTRLTIYFKTLSRNNLKKRFNWVTELTFQTPTLFNRAPTVVSGVNMKGFFCAEI